jgi:AbrB family looped-hinge helix DNA binding protein
MLTIVANNENPGTISIPANELEKLGIKEGEEVEFSKNENDEIVLRSKTGERTRKILAATREIIENRKSALIEFGKGLE